MRAARPNTVSEASKGRAYVDSSTASSATQERRRHAHAAQSFDAPLRGSAGRGDEARTRWAGVELRGELRRQAERAAVGVAETALALQEDAGLLGAAERRLALRAGAAAGLPAVDAALADGEAFAVADRQRFFAGDALVAQDARYFAEAKHARPPCDE